jgi:hypothetical protein
MDSRGLHKLWHRRGDEVELIWETQGRWPSPSKWVKTLAARLERRRGKREAQKAKGGH